MMTYVTHRVTVVKGFIFLVNTNTIFLMRSFDYILVISSSRSVSCLLYKYGLSISLAQMTPVWIFLSQRLKLPQKSLVEGIKILYLAHPSRTADPISSPAVAGNLSLQRAELFLCVLTDFFSLSRIRDNKQKVVCHKIFRLASPGCRLYSLFSMLKDVRRKDGMNFSKVLPSKQPHHLSF